MNRPDNEPAWLSRPAPIWLSAITVVTTVAVAILWMEKLGGGS